MGEEYDVTWRWGVGHILEVKRDPNREWNQLQKVRVVARRLGKSTIVPGAGVPMYLVADVRTGKQYTTYEDTLQETPASGAIGSPDD